MMRRPFCVAASLLLCVLLAGAAAAQDQVGVAIAASGEGQVDAAHGANADTTMAAARTKCQAAGESCLRVRWCYPAGYAGVMSYLAKREVTLMTYTCGAPSFQGLSRMLAAWCAALPEASECRLVTTWDPSGNEIERRDLLGKNTAD